MEQQQKGYLNLAAIVWREGKSERRVRINKWNMK